MSQVRYVIYLANVFNKANIVYWLYIKLNKVIKSVLALELYAIVHGFDIRAVTKSTIEKIFNIKLLPIIVFINSKSYIIVW